MANTAFTHDPTITVPGSGNTVNNRVVTWNGTTGKVFHNAATVTINAGVVAGVTALTVDDITVDGTSITTIASNNSINITPHGTGSVVISKVDINDGAIDGTAIGAASASTIAGTTLSASTSLKTPLIEYTDGDDAITIADGGGITVAQNAIFTGTVRTPSVLLSGSSNILTLDVASVTAAYTIIFPDAVPGAAGKVLKSSGSSPFSTLEWGDAGGALSTKRVQATYTQGTTSDPQTISGAGFQPTKVEIIAATGTTTGGSSIGHSDSSNSEFCTSLQSNDYFGTRPGYIVHISNGNWTLNCTCTINSDGCSLDWTSAGSGWEPITLSVMFSR